MSRLTLFLLGVGLSLVALATIATPAPVRAAYVKLAYDASLQETPDDAGSSLTMLPAGVVVTITGDPVNSYYPVTAGGNSGWVRGDSLAFDAATESASVEPLAAAPDPEAAVASEPEGEELVPAEPESDEPVLAEPVVDDSLPVEPAAEATPVAEPVVQAPIPPEAAAAEPAADLATQNPPAAAPAAGAPELALDPNAPSVAVPDPGPVGPAAVMADVAIYAGPGAEFGVLGTAATGQLVEQTGHAVSGYVTVRYVGVTGWVPLDHLGPPPTADSSASAQQTGAQS